MRTRWWLGLVVAALLVVTACGDDGGSGTPSATLRIHAGVVEVDSGDGFAAGSDGLALSEGTTVRTGPDGRAAIEWFDGSVTRLDFSTTFKIITVAALEGDGKIIEGEQTTGNTYNRVTELTDSSSRFEIETPTATASVQGTVFAVLLNPDGSMTVAVTEGTVLVNGVEVTVGMYVTISPDGSVSEPLPIPEDLIADDWIVYNCELDDGPDCPDAVDTTTTTVAGPDEPSSTTTSTSTSTTSTTTTTLPPPPPPPATTTTTLVGPGPEPPPPPPDEDAPVIEITDGPEGPTAGTTAEFLFTSNEPGVAFMCDIDGEGYAACPPIQVDQGEDLGLYGLPAGGAGYYELGAGPHTFQVSFTDLAGNTGYSDLYEWHIFGPLDAIGISPESTVVGPGVGVTYGAEGFDEWGVSLGAVPASYDIVDGTCAGDECSAESVGDHAVTGSVGEITDTATLTVVEFGSGDVEVFLSWIGPADMDLWVYEPPGTERTYYGNTTSSTGGHLDFDWIPGCGSSETAEWTEHIYWPEGQAPLGTFTAVADAYNLCGFTTDWTMTIYVDGALVHTVEGTFTSDADSQSQNFTVPTNA